MRVAVTGATGFIGSAFAAALARAGHAGVTFDLRKAVPGRFDDVDAVVHLAAIAHRRGVREADLERVNVELAAQVGRAAAAAGSRLIFVSSVKVHGEETAAPLREDSPLAPLDAYGRSKVRAEEALRAVPGLRLTVIRPPLVYGAGVKANFLALMKGVANGLPLPFACVRNRRSLLFVGNLADALIRCLAKPQSEGRTYLLTDGAAVSTPELCRALGDALGRRARLWPMPLSLLQLAPPLGRLIRSLEVDDSAIRGELDWRPPFAFEEGLRTTAQWYRTTQ
jgi:nucleoside-diphosphate-sugar epimerase